MLIRVLLAAALLCCLPGFAMAASALPPPYADLVAEAEAIDAMDAIMPVRIFNLASRFAEAPDKELTAKLVDTRLTCLPGKWGFGRRVGYTTLRFMKEPSYASIDLPAVIMRGLDDPAEWVRYDAIWLGDVTQLDTPAFRAKLAELAKGLDPAAYDKVPTSDAKQQRQRRAGKLLQKLNAQ